MSEETYTPAPWNVLPDELQVRARGCVIAEVITQQNAPANARLISAAPNLYAALKELEWCSNGYCPQCANGPVLGHQPKCILANALAKAVGK